MKILMTGATGFVGQFLGRALVQRGHDLVVLSRDPERAEIHSSYPARFFKWDGEKQSAPQEAFNNVDVIIHLAGESIADGRWTAKRKQKLRDSRILATQNLLEGLKISRAQPKVFIGASAIGYYGYSRATNIDEYSSRGADFVANLCEDWENESAKVEELISSIRRVQLRIGVVLGEGGGFFAKLVPLFERGAGAVLGSGKQWVSWIQVDDLVRLIVEGLNNEKYRGVINAAAPHPITNAEMTQKLADHLKVSTLPKVPALALKAVYGELSELLVNGAAVTSKKLKDLGFKFQSRTFSEALKRSLPFLGAGESQIVFRQWVPFKKENIFPFFADESNLQKITPEWLHFQVTRKSEGPMSTGSEFDYQIRFRGFPLHWSTRIEAWNPPESFADVQVKGPYAKWYHYHLLEDLAGGTLLTDRVTYKLPVGYLGRATAGPFVQKDIERIFKHRQLAIREYLR